MGAKGLARGRSHAIRPWPNQEAYEGKDGAANETLAIYFWQIRGTEAVSYEEYFRQIFGGLGVLPVFWSSQERLTRNIFRKYFSPKS